MAGSNGGGRALCDDIFSVPGRQQLPDLTSLPCLALGRPEAKNHSDGSDLSAEPLTRRKRQQDGRKDSQGPKLGCEAMEGGRGSGGQIQPEDQGEIR